ncbi:hypothetical protein B9G98_01224 [Wickerhamiella sorbophila]|uniref:Non-structural maintenance of chromosomes element 4 n=1 Tax=Wickerhamiella sorbophila TaxID=45607 RepID=A0A2T0FF55_9ASCO|nr:hypothetical protein B9G98_01224 [Wickerhamiella sorbophila]PRT53604.1 hypothetical protein B9G98_01224 [Wickerhamiella sorbophila]
MTDEMFELERLKREFDDHKAHYVDPNCDIQSFRSFEREMDQNFERFVRGRHNGSLMERDSELLSQRADASLQRVVGQLRGSNYEITKERFLDAIVSLGNDHNLDRPALLCKLGRVVVRNSNQVFGWIYDPITTPPDVPATRAPRRRHQRPIGDTAAPELVERSDDAEDPVKQLVESMFVRIVDYEEAGGPPLDIFRVVLNAQHFGQTVENVYALSTLVSALKVTIYNDGEENIPHVRTAQRLKESKPRQQFVFTLNYSQWQQLCARYPADAFMPSRLETS